MTGGRYSVAKVLRDVDPAEHQLVTICAADQKPTNVDFIWSNGNGKLGGRLARGKHTCFAGEGGLGKSTLLMRLWRVATTIRPPPMMLSSFFGRS